MAKGLTNFKAKKMQQNLWSGSLLVQFQKNEGTISNYSQNPAQFTNGIMVSLLSP